MSTKTRRVKRSATQVHGGAGNETPTTPGPGDDPATDMIPDRPTNYAKTAAVSLTYADANPDTIVRGAGSFLTDGWLAGMVVVITGTATNDKKVTIATVVALTITLIAADTLLAETVSSTLSSLNQVPGDNPGQNPQN